MSEEIKLQATKVHRSYGGAYVEEYTICGSFNKRERAAMELRVPESGTPWLDKMIDKSNRHELAKAALAAMLVNGGGLIANYVCPALDVADAMIGACGE